MPERMLQVMIRDDIQDKMDDYLKRVNESGKFLHKYSKRQLVAEAVIEYMDKHVVEGKV